MTSSAPPTDWLRRYFDEMRDLVIVVDFATGEILEANEGGCVSLGYALSDVIGGQINAFVHPDDQPLFSRTIEAVSTGGDSHYEQRWRNAYGSWVTFSVYANLIDESRLLVCGRNLSDLAEALRLVELCEDLMIVSDMRGRVQWANGAAVRMHDLGGPDRYRGARLIDYLAEESKDEYRRFSAEAFKNGRGSARFTALRGDGSKVELWVRTVFDPDRKLWYTVERDISESVRAETELVRLNTELQTLAATDNLTGLANRRAFMIALNGLLADVAPFALIMVDLDKFKAINDTLGHGTGDELLRTCGERLRACIRPSDLAARLGGDEFGLLLPGVHSTEVAARRAGEILASLDGSFTIEGRSVTTSASIGVVMAESRRETALDLMGRADLAMYRAKQRGRHRFELFDAELHREMTEQISIESDLRSGLADDRLRADVQGIFDAHTLTLQGCEALARWTHPELGPIAAERLISVAEDAGLLDELTTKMIHRVATDSRAWSTETTVGLNVAPSQLAGPDFAELMVETVRAVGRAPSDFVIEMTETGITGTLVTALPTLQRLRDAGFSLVIDDFGKGASSLGYLRDLPIDAVKIDGSFVHNLATDEVARTITSSVIELANRIGLSVVAEWVESPEQLRLLREMGCGQVQGFLLHRPQPMADFDPRALARADLAY